MDGILGFLFILLLFLIFWILSWIDDLINTKEVIEYYPNGEIKLKGSTRFENRIGQFELFDQRGNLILNLTYRDGDVCLAEYINISVGTVWKKIESNNGVMSTKIDFSAIPDNANIDQIMLESVKANWIKLADMPDKYKNDREVVLEAVRIYGWSLNCASDELKNDREVVLAAIALNYYALNYASDELLNNREVVLEAVRINGCSLIYASDELKNDREVVLVAIASNYEVLSYASVELKNDGEVVLEAELAKIESLLKKNKTALK